MLYLSNVIRQYIASNSTYDLIWLGIGLLGQFFFMMRFVVQWVHSEKHQKSLIPKSFWYFSLLGGLVVLLYGFHRMDPVIILGQLPGTFIYSRNLILLGRHEKQVNDAV